MQIFSFHMIEAAYTACRKLILRNVTAIRILKNFFVLLQFISSIKKLQERGEREVSSILKREDSTASPVTILDWRRWKTFDAVTFSPFSLSILLFLLVWCFSIPPLQPRYSGVNGNILRIYWHRVLFFWLIFHYTILHLSLPLHIPLREFFFLAAKTKCKRETSSWMWQVVYRWDWVCICKWAFWNGAFETPAKYSRPQANFNHISISIERINHSIFSDSREVFEWDFYVTII